MTKSISDLGTRQIHEKHSVMIEGGVIPRAKVMDQLIVDKLLMDGRITLSQHMAAELFLGQAERACINVRAQKYDSIPVGNGKRDSYSNGYGAFSKTVSLVQVFCDAGTPSYNPIDYDPRRLEITTTSPPRS